MLLLLMLKILDLNLLHRNNFRDCHFSSSPLWLLEMCFDHKNPSWVASFKNFRAAWKLIVTTYLSFCNLQFGSFKPSQSNFKAKASSFVSLNSSSVSHRLVLRTTASTPQEAEEIRHQYNLENRMTSLPYSHSPPIQTEIDKNYMNTDNKFPCYQLPQCL